MPQKVWLFSHLYLSQFVHRAHFLLMPIIVSNKPGSNQRAQLRDQDVEQVEVRRREGTVP